MITLQAILIKVVGSGIAKGILNLWLDEEMFEREIGKNFISIFASKTDDLIAQRRGSRQFEEISEKIAENLLPIFNSASGNIPEERKIEIAQLAGQAINGLELSPKSLSANRLEPKEIENILLSHARFPNEESPLIHYGEPELALYKRVISEASQYIVDIADSLPKFNLANFSEILKRQDLLLDKANAILNEVRLMQKNTETLSQKISEFDSNYRRAIVRNLDELELFGVDLSGSSKRYRLSVAYVSLSVEYRFVPEQLDDEIDQSKTDSFIDYTSEVSSIDEIIEKTNLLLVRGSAGSGKTTLMKWISVMAAGHSFENPLQDWNHGIPFFIRLREFSESTLPKIADFPSLAAPAISGEMPPNWIIDKFRNGEAIVLVDGIDELSESKRPRVKAWIKDISETYPGNKWIVTSRPYAAASDWLEDLGFIGAELQSMGRSDIQQFIRHWHNAIKESENSTIKKNELDTLENKLNRTIRENANIRKLATNPLLCAMICALHRDRSTQLPSDRVELYEACINMFLRRDNEREVDLKDYVEISDRQKRSLLADFAYWLIKNSWSEVTVNKADNRFDQKLIGLSNVPTTLDGSLLRRYFVERSGILRQPTSMTIDFPHRTFEEYLAAKAIVEEGDFGLLTEKILDDQWREVIQLTCGLARLNESNDIILKILELGDKYKKKRVQLHLLAVACMNISLEVDSDIKAQVQTKLKQLIPPNNITEAKELAKAGELVLPYLRYNSSWKANQAAASVRTLVLIGEEALKELKAYSKDVRIGVQEAIAEGIKYYDSKIEYAKELKLQLHRLRITNGIPISILFHFKNLTYLEVKKTDEEIKDLHFTAGFEKLTGLRINGSKIRDLSPIARLTSLRLLEIKGSKIQDLSPLSTLDKIQFLNIKNSDIEKIDPIAPLQNIVYLNVSNSKLTDLKALNNFQNILMLDASSTKLSDISFVENMKELRFLNISSTDVDSLEPLRRTDSRQKSGKWPFVTTVGNHFFVSHSRGLEVLDVSGTKVSSLDPLADLLSLRELDVSCTSISDLRPLENSKTLAYLKITINPENRLQVERLKRVRPDIKIINKNYIGNDNWFDRFPAMYYRY